MTFEEIEGLKNRIAVCLHTKSPGWDMAVIAAIAKIQHGAIWRMFLDHDWKWNQATKLREPNPSDALEFANKHYGSIATFSKRYGYSATWAARRIEKELEKEGELA